jgi:hypothetical protein
MNVNECIYISLRSEGGTMSGYIQEGRPSAVMWHLWMRLKGVVDKWIEYLGYVNYKKS